MSHPHITLTCLAKRRPARALCDLLELALAVPDHHYDLCLIVNSDSTSCEEYNCCCDLLQESIGYTPPPFSPSTSTPPNSPSSTHSAPQAFFEESSEFDPVTDSSSGFDCKSDF